MKNRRMAKFRRRTWIRGHLPWFLIDRGLAGKGTVDCGDHGWYNSGWLVEHCYQCTAGVRRRVPEAAAAETIRPIDDQ
jgi:hypothetical protein